MGAYYPDYSSRIVDFLMCLGLEKRNFVWWWIRLCCQSDQPHSRVRGQWHWVQWWLSMSELLLLYCTNFWMCFPHAVSGITSEYQHDHCNVTDGPAVGIWWLNFDYSPSIQPLSQTIRPGMCHWAWFSPSSPEQITSHLKATPQLYSISILLTSTQQHLHLLSSWHYQPNTVNTATTKSN